jgi:hypothetical protein
LLNIRIDIVSRGTSAFLYSFANEERIRVIACR